MTKEFVISDIHGCYKTFRYLLEEILQPSQTDHIYLLGDYINKGPSSKNTLDYIMDLIDSGFKVSPLMGNHEKHMIDALDDPTQFHVFIDKGGAYTLKDFEVDKISNIPDKYLSFIKSLEWFVEKDDWFLVHAGFDFNSEDPFSDTDAMLNIRHIDYVPTFIKNKKIIHGHVPVPLGQIINQMKQPYQWNYFLDGGCVYPLRDGMGFLVGIELQEMKLYVKECIDEVE